MAWVEHSTKKRFRLRASGIATCAGALLACACRSPASSTAKPEPARSASVASAAPSSVATATASVAPVPVAPVDRSLFPWLDDATLDPPKPVDDLEGRFATPPGFTRAPLEPKSFGAWLRKLPLAAPGTPVRAYDGSELHPATDPRIAAVIALDVSKADLQQCADTVIRLHAEWCWWSGRRDMSYRAASGMDLPYARWARGERLVPDGRGVSWVLAGGVAKNDHASFRKYLDAVFAWANTVSLERQAKPVASGQVRPGDFFILPGNPGHAVIVLDLATGQSGMRALLGQSYMPAQNAQVLRARDGNAWFSLDPGRDVDTPFWKPFPWSSLRRIE